MRCGDSFSVAVPSNWSEWQPPRLLSRNSTVPQKVESPSRSQHLLLQQQPLILPSSGYGSTSNFSRASEHPLLLAPVHQVTLKVRPFLHKDFKGSVTLTVFISHLSIGAVPVSPGGPKKMSVTSASEDLPTFKEVFVAPKQSLVACLMTKPILRQESSFIDYDSSSSDVVTYKWPWQCGTGFH